MGPPLSSAVPSKCCSFQQSANTNRCICSTSFRPHRPSSTHLAKRRMATVAAAAKLTETTVEFRNHRGEKLIGTLVEPPSASVNSDNNSSTSSSAAQPVALLAHGYMSSRNSELLVRLSTALARSAGLSSFRFDFSGNGDSEGEFRYGQYR